MQSLKNQIGCSQFIQNDLKYITELIQWGVRRGHSPRRVAALFIYPICIFYCFCVRGLLSALRCGNRPPLWGLSNHYSWLSHCQQQAHTTAKWSAAIYFNPPQWCQRLGFQLYTKNLLLYMQTFVCPGWCACMQVCKRICQSYFLASSLCRDVTVFWLPHSDSLWECTL